MRYDIIALDLDGTLTNEKKEITPYTKEVLMAYQKAGGCIVLASGRPPHGILPLAEELELEKYGGYMLAFNGAIVYECSTKKIIYQQTFEKPLTDIVWELGREYGVGMLTYHEDELLTEDANDEYVGIEAFITKMKVVQKENLSEAIQFPVNKMMLLADGDRLAKIEKKVQAIIGDRLSVYRSAPFFLEVMAKDIDKAQSLKRLLNYKNRTVEQLAAFGDGFNDGSMLRFAGLGVAMDNAEDEVKALADCVTKSNEEDGVAWMVKDFF